MLNPERWNNPAEVTRGVLGVTRPEKATHGPYTLLIRHPFKCTCKLPKPLPERDPCTPEQIKYDFQLLQERTILGAELRFAIRASLHGHRDHFPTINASNRPRFCLKRPCIHPQNGFERPQNRSQKWPNRLFLQTTTPQHIIFNYHKV